MSAVNPSSPAPVPHADPTQTLRLLELELARARARRLSRENGASGSRQTMRALCVLFLLALMGAGCYAFWRAQELRGEIQRVSPPPVQAIPAKGP